MPGENHLSLIAEEGAEGNCPVCEREFDADEWIETSVGADAWGGSAHYECPTDNCEGTASVSW